MPTTCGFPNCKFRSRYRGSEDSRHFYRVPKKPAAVRERWLQAIGRTEQTIVNQLRVCSGHFQDGQKREGEIPVADPSVDSPITVQLPPRSLKRVSCVEKRRDENATAADKGLATAGAVEVRNDDCSARGRGQEGDETLAEERRMQMMQQLPQQQQPTCAGEITLNCLGHRQASSCTVIPVIIANAMCSSGSPDSCAPSKKPLVALLDGRDCSVEMPVLRELATVAFCDAQCVAEVHEKVLNEAVAALMWSSMKLGPAELSQFKRLKLLVQLGPGRELVDLEAARSLGISVSCISGACVEETADSTISLILSLYRRTVFLASRWGAGGGHELVGISGSGPVSIDRMAELAAGATRIRGQTLGLVGFGRVGTAVALRAQAFGFHVLVFDPNLPEGAEKAAGVARAQSLEQLVSGADCVSLHCPLLMENRGMLSERLIRGCAKETGFFLINTCSLELMDETAVAEALTDGVIRGLGLDVPDGCGALTDGSCPNVIATPGSAFYSDQSHLDLRRLAAEEIRRGLEGRIPESLKHCVNLQDLSQPGLITEGIEVAPGSEEQLKSGQKIRLTFGL